MKVLVAGGTGFVGSFLVKHLYQQGHTVTVLSRHPARYDASLGAYCKLLHWDACSIPNQAYFEGIEAIVNLMGENIGAKKWSPERKTRLYNSRVISTEFLAQAALNGARQLKVFVSGSAVGYYDMKQRGLLHENSPAGTGFLSDVCRDWEAALKALIKKPGLRVCQLRTGLVLGNGGALDKLLPLFKWGLGSNLGSGKQAMNWIHIADLIGIIMHMLETDSVSGAYNAVSPTTDTNAVFTATLASVLNRPRFIPVPAFVLQLVLGEMSCLLLEGAHCCSEKIQQSGYTFQYRQLENALRDCCH
mgnify:CR=1 FL=1